MTRGLAASVAAVLVAVCVAAGAAERDYTPTTLIYPPFGHCLGLHRATTFHLFLYLGTRTSFDEPAGLAAVKLISEDDPSTTSDDDELTVFGLNSGRCEIIYNKSLVAVGLYGECGDGPGQFRYPLGIAADERGNVFVADTGNHRVVRLLYDDDEIRHVKSFGSEGGGDGQLVSPSHIALGHSGRLDVSDTGNDRVVVMSPTGRFESTIEGDAESGVMLEGPVGLAAVEGDDPWISRRQSFIAVADRQGRRLLKLAHDGAVLGQASAADVPFPDASFGYLAIDYYGSVYATDRAGGRIHKFDNALRYVTSVGRPGTDDMELDEPRGITLWRRFGQIFVTEREGAQYFWIGTDILDATVTPGSVVPDEGGFEVRYVLTEVSRVSLEVVDGSGEVVHTVVPNRRRAIGANVEHWNGTRGRRGGSLPEGPYTLRPTAAPTYSSGEYFQDTEEMSVILEPPASP